ncbi:unnamed protein product [Victoria cruziana]
MKNPYIPPVKQGSEFTTFSCFRCFSFIRTDFWKRNSECDYPPASVNLRFKGDMGGVIDEERSPAGAKFDRFLGNFPCVGCIWRARTPRASSNILLSLILSSIDIIEYMDDEATFECRALGNISSH